MSANSVLIVGQDAGRAEALRAVLLGLGQVVIAVATSSRFALQAAIEHAPAAVFIDVDFRGELDAAALAGALRGSAQSQVVLYAGSPTPRPDTLTGLPFVSAPFTAAEVRMAWPVSAC